MEENGALLPDKNEGNSENLDWERKHDITAEEVKTTNGFAHLTDEQAEEVVEFVKAFCNLMYNLNKQQTEKDNKKDNSEPKRAA